MTSELVARARYCHEYGIFDAVRAGMMVYYGELADEIERLTAQLAEEQRISNLRGDTINKMLDQMAEADQQLAEARQAERVARIEGVRAGIEASAGALRFYSCTCCLEVRALDPAAIVEGMARSAALSDLIAGDADMIDGGDDGKHP